MMALANSELSENQVLIIRLYSTEYRQKDETGEDYIGLLNLDMLPNGTAKAKGFLATDFCVTNRHVDEFAQLCKKEGVKKIIEPMRGTRHGALGLLIRRINEILATVDGA